MGSLVCNRAVADVQERLQARVWKHDIEVHADSFAYLRKFDQSNQRR